MLLTLHAVEGKSNERNGFKQTYLKSRFCQDQNKPFNPITNKLTHKYKEMNTQINT